MITRKNRLQFYLEFRHSFPEIDQMEFWKEYNYINEPFSSSGIMNEIGKIAIEWAERSEFEKTQRLMNFFEQSYQLYNDEATCYIYTDFLPTIISMENSELRETIKTQILPETMKLYNQLVELGFYMEN